MPVHLNQQPHLVEPANFSRQPKSQDWFYEDVIEFYKNDATLWVLSTQLYPYQKISAFIAQAIPVRYK